MEKKNSINFYVYRFFFYDNLINSYHFSNLLLHYIFIIFITFTFMFKLKTKWKLYISDCEIRLVKYLFRCMSNLFQLDKKKIYFIIHIQFVNKIFPLLYFRFTFSINPLILFFIFHYYCFSFLSIFSFSYISFDYILNENYLLDKNQIKIAPIS